MAFSRPYTGSIPASDITSGTVATARLGSGTANSSTYLRGDQTWATISGGGATVIDDLTDVTITAAASGDFLRHNGTAWVDATISASDIPSGVDAIKIGGGAVSNTEFGYLDGVTSAIQTQLDAKQSLIAYEYSWPADVTKTYSAGTYQTIHTTSSLAVGRYRWRSHVNHVRVTASAVVQRLQAGTASLAGATNDALGHGILEGNNVQQIRISSTSPWTTTAPLKSSADNQATHILEVTFEVTSAGTVVLQMTHNASNDVTEKKGSLIQIWKVA